MQLQNRLLIRLTCMALLLFSGVMLGWGIAATVQASPSYQCSPPPPQCKFDPKTGQMTCTKVCQSTPPPQATQPPRSTPPTPPPGATNTPVPRETPPPCIGTNCGTPIFGTPVGTATPCLRGPCSTTTPPPAPTPIGYATVRCYGVANLPPPIIAWFGPDLAQQAESRGYDGVIIRIVYANDGRVLDMQLVDWCLPIAATPTPTPTTPPKEPPCPIIISGNGIDISCGPYYNEISATADVPCMQVDRSPAPRGLVTVENMFWLTPGVGENGNYPQTWSDSCWPIPNSPVERKPYNYRIGVRWKRLTGMPPQWDFNERPWNVGRSGATDTGMMALHTYETASFGLPANGPSLEGEFNLPAYQVKAHSYWVAEWAQAWEYFTWECPEGKERDDGFGPYCTVPEIRVWRDAFDGWYPIDLTRYGNPTYYFDSTRVESPDARVIPSRVCLPYIPVPMVESQSVIGR
ncbi:MAG: hypothetical protein ABI874_05650 [Chloroflexota bacterium]